MNKIAIGIDVGISTTKIVGIRGGEVVSPLWIKATDPVTSLYGAFGKFLHDNDIALDDVERVMLTGVGAAYINSPIYGLTTQKVEEFIADGLGAAFESKLNRMIVVSMGTGTSLVSYQDGAIRHLGGIGIGGGTLNGLSRLLLQTDDIKQISQMALDGDITHINLSIGDISAHPLPGLPMDATASLFANAQGLQAIGSASILSSLNSGIRDFVLIGNLSRLPQCNELFPKLEELYDVRFIIPKSSEFCTAIGAALSYVNNKRPPLTPPEGGGEPTPYSPIPAK